MSRAKHGVYYPVLRVALNVNLFLNQIQPCFCPKCHPVSEPNDTLFQNQMPPCFRSKFSPVSDPNATLFQILSGLGPGVPRLPGLPRLPQPVPRQSPGGPAHGGRLQVHEDLRDPHDHDLISTQDKAKETQVTVYRIHISVYKDNKD